MKQNNEERMIAVAYELSVDIDGEETIVEECLAERPFRFVTGVGYTFEVFEKILKPLKEGETFDFIIDAADANGPRDEDYVFDVDKSLFCVDGEFQHEEVYPGNIVPLLDADGNRLQATIVAVKRDKVTIDLNHPLAGKDLHFRGSVVENRVATAEELQSVTRGCCGGCHGGGCEGGGCEGDGCHGGGGCEGGCHGGGCE